MAVVVTDLRTTQNAANVATGWTGAAGAISSVVYVEGGNAWVGTLNIATGQIYHTGTARDISDTLVYVWSNNFALQGPWDAAQPPNALHLGDGTNRISIRMAGSNRKTFTHLSSTDPFVDWDCLVVDGSLLSTLNGNGRIIARAGTFAAYNSASNTQFGSDFTTLSKGLGGGTNVATDIIRFGNNGIRVTGGTTSDRGKFEEVVAVDQLTTTDRAHGLIRELGSGLYGCQGPLNFGNPDAADNSWFDDSGRVLSFENRDIANDKYYLSVHGHVSATNLFRLNNSTVTTAGPFVRCDFNGGNVNTLTITNNSFTGLGNAITFSNLADATGHTVTGNVFNACGRIDPGTVTFNNNTISNSTDAGGAMLLDADGTANMSNLTFLSGVTGHAILITATGTYDFTNFSFTGYGVAETVDSAVYNNSGGAVTINVSGGTVPTVRNGTGATTTIVAAVTITLTGLETDTEVRAYTQDVFGNNDVEIAGVENSGTSFAFSAEAGEIINIMINHLNFLPADLWDFLVPSANASVPISQVIDRQYFNPPGP